MQSVARVGSDLLAATESPEALPGNAAWNARNMVELAVWVRYCGKSEKNARHFHEDAFRDLKDIVFTLAQLHKLIGRRAPPSKRPRTKSSISWRKQNWDLTR